MSTRKNTIYNMAYRLFSMLLPLVTAPWLSRAVGTEGVGLYGYAWAISYTFGLIGLLGLENYGPRAIAQAKDDPNQLNRTFSSIWRMQLLVAGFTLLLWCGYVAFIAGAEKEIALHLTLASAACLVNVDWCLMGLDQFRPIALRNTAVKLIAAAAVFIFVKAPDDLWIYAFVWSLSTFIGCVSCFISLRGKVKLVSVPWKEALRHLRPCAVLSISVIAVSVYRQMDKVMIGALADMDQTGLYENADKIILCLAGFIAAIGTVMLPKISHMTAQGRMDEVKKHIDASMELVMCMVCALGFGLASIAPEFSVLFYGEAEGLNVDLGEALGATHDVGGVDGLVGRDHDHLLNTVLDTLVGDIAGASDIDEDGLAGVLLHQGDVLIGCSMEDNSGTVLAEGEIETGKDTHIADDGHEVEVGEALLELQTEVVHGGLSIIEKNKLLNSKGSQLTTELTTDTTGRTGDHDDLTTEVGHNLIHGNLYLGTTEEVLNLYLTDGVAHHLTAYHLVDRGLEEGFDVALACILDKAFLLELGIGSGSKEDGIGTQATLKVLHIRLGAEIVDLIVADGMWLITIARDDEANNIVVGRVLEASKDGDGLVLNAINEHTAALVAMAVTVDDQVVGYNHGHTHKHQHAQGEEEVDDDKYHQMSGGEPAQGESEQGQREQQPLAYSCQGQTAYLSQGTVTNDGAIGLEGVEHDDRGHSTYRQPINGGTQG